MKVMQKRWTAALALALCLSGIGIVSVHGQDLQTRLSYFLNDLYAGTLGSSISFSAIALKSDTASISMGVSSDTVLCRGAANLIGIGGCTSSFPAIKRNGTNVDIRLADDSAPAALNAGSISSTGFVTSTGSGLGFRVNSTLLISTNAPTISSGFGASPSIVANNGPSAFTLNVGTGGAATSGVVGLPTATTGWSCFANDRTNNTVTRQTATTTTSATFTAAAAWAASDILNISCFGY